MNETTKKPRLKLCLSGNVSLLSPGINNWTERQAKAWVQKNYGSLANFARCFSFEYHHVLVAFERREDAAGGVGSVRQLLGLKSQPTAASQAQVEAQQRRRAARFVTRQSVRASERQERQNARAGCVGDSHCGSRA